MAANTSPSSLHAHLGYWLRTVSNAVSHAFARKLDGAGVTVAEWVFLRALHDYAPIGPTQLAERLGMTKGAISKLADRLVEKEFAVRAADLRDRRAQQLALTPAGRFLVPRLAGIADANDAAFFGALSAEERSRLQALLGKLVEIHGLTAPPID